jgi:hypothetical protein
MTDTMMVKYCTPEDCINPDCHVYKMRERYNQTVRDNVAYAEHQAATSGNEESRAFWQGRADATGRLLVIPTPTTMHTEVAAYCDRCGLWRTTTPVYNESGSSFQRLCVHCAKPFSHEYANGVRCYNTDPIIWANGEDCLHDDTDYTAS